MSYIQQYFGKAAQDLTYQDIEDYFTSEKEESDKMEFKSYYSSAESDREKENGIIRSVCAFLNSVGGIIVWGAPVGQNIPSRTEKVFQGNLSPVTKLIEKDYFINRVTDSITPAPNNISFHTITDNGNHIYLIEVLQSEYSPHQFRNIYYMRIDGQTKPAPHHYIEALFRKVTYPRLKGFITLTEFQEGDKYCTLGFVAMIFNLSKLQNENNVSFKIVLPHSCTFNHLITYSHSSKNDGTEIRISEPAETIHYGQPYKFISSISINRIELQNHNSEFEIWFYFGGKKSPLLISKYKLKIDFSNPIPDNLNDLFVEIDENRYAFEHSDDLGLIEADQIREIIGRLSQ